MNTNIYKISNSKIICRVLPFFARGRKLVLFLEAISIPLMKLNRDFVDWAYEMVLRVKMTAQTTVLTWYLNYKFRSRFINQQDSFVILQDDEIDYLIAFNIDENIPVEVLGKRIVNTNEQSLLTRLSKPMKDFSQRMFSYVIVINAPAITTTASYTNKHYLRDITQVLNYYKISFVKYDIVIN